MSDNRGMYLVWCPELGGKQAYGMHVSAPGPDYAAEEWAEKYDDDCAEYPIAKGQEVTVHVLDLATSRETRWRVVGEYIPNYTAIAESADE